MPRHSGPARRERSREPSTRGSPPAATPGARSREWSPQADASFSPTRGGRATQGPGAQGMRQERNRETAGGQPRSRTPADHAAAAAHFALTADDESLIQIFSEGRTDTLMRKELFARMTASNPFRLLVTEREEQFRKAGDFAKSVMLKMLINTVTKGRSTAAMTDDDWKGFRAIPSGRQQATLLQSDWNTNKAQIMERAWLKGQQLDEDERIATESLLALRSGTNPPPDGGASSSQGSNPGQAQSQLQTRAPSQRFDLAQIQPRDKKTPLNLGDQDYTYSATKKSINRSRDNNRAQSQVKARIPPQRFDLAQIHPRDSGQAQVQPQACPPPPRFDLAQTQPRDKGTPFNPEEQTYMYSILQKSINRLKDNDQTQSQLQVHAPSLRSDPAQVQPRDKRTPLSLEDQAYIHSTTQKNINRSGDSGQAGSRERSAGAQPQPARPVQPQRPSQEGKTQANAPLEKPLAKGLQTLITPEAEDHLHTHLEDFVARDSRRGQADRPPKGADAGAGKPRQKNSRRTSPSKSR